MKFLLSLFLLISLPSFADLKTLCSKVFLSKKETLIERINQGDKNFSLKDLSGAELIGLDLEWAIFRGANLTLAVFKEANLGKADFTRANLRGVNLFKADLTGAVWTGADLSGAMIDSIYREKLKGALNTNQIIWID